LHYLGSIRKNSITLALRNKYHGYAIGVMSLSKFDLHHIDISPFSSGQAMVISRIYTLNESPYNTNSYFFGLVLKWIKTKCPNVKILLTYLNRNLEFNGTLYKSTNWRLLAFENNVRYNYYSGNYVTDRFLLEHFKSSDESKLKQFSEITFSQWQLFPLEIYYYPVKDHLTELPYQEVNILRN
jgi:hypothetical protein